MNARERRHRLTVELLQADGPRSLPQLARACGLSAGDVEAILAALVDDGQVVAAEPAAGAAPLYRWAARWREEADARARAPRQALAARLADLEARHGDVVDLEQPPARAQHDFVVGAYEPPPDKRWLVFAQCSVRRPFSTSPSHASVRRAVACATGFDPGTEMARCPVHVVVLASRIGPVPYDLQDLYPATVRGGGVKEFGADLYARSRPILVQRMADYLTARGARYDAVAGFGEGRYGQILQAAGERAGRPFPVLPRAGGPHLTRVGRSTPRKYWEKTWIQLYREIHAWLDPAQRPAAEARLAALDVEVAG